MKALQGGLVGEQPHPRLLPLLEEHGITVDEFWSRGRAASRYTEAKSAIITSLHVAGTTWAEMIEITGLSNGTIQRLSRATWNDASRENRKANARLLGQRWSGRKRPGQLNRQWEKGDFESLRGRQRTESECTLLKQGWTPEKKMAKSAQMKALWDDPRYRAPLMDFHRSPQERRRRSRVQSERMAQDPVKWTRGKGCYVNSFKCNKSQFWVRSTYESRAVEILEGDDLYISFVYEPRFEVEGRSIKPDFLVKCQDGSTTLIEVKAAWVLSQPESTPALLRLERSRKVAMMFGWSFAVWTEKELGR